MDLPMRNSGCSSFSKRCCFFPSIFLLLIVAILGVSALIVIFILKPHKPTFSVQAITLDAYKLNAYSSSTLFVSSVASLFLNASNPSKVGIRYSPSRLQLYLEDLPIAVIRVPGFSQPALSSNVTLKLRVLIPCVNVSQIIAGRLVQDQSGQNVVQMKMLGDVKVNLHLLHITLPKIKVALACDIDFDYRELAFIHEFRSKKVARNPIASFPNESKSCLRKCDIAIYI